MQALRTTYFARTLDASHSPAVTEPHTTVITELICLRRIPILSRDVYCFHVVPPTDRQREQNTHFQMVFVNTVVVVPRFRFVQVTSQTHYLTDDLTGYRNFPLNKLF